MSSSSVSRSGVRFLSLHSLCSFSRFFSSTVSLEIVVAVASSSSSSRRRLGVVLFCSSSSSSSSSSRRPSPASPPVRLCPARASFVLSHFRVSLDFVLRFSFPFFLLLRLRSSKRRRLQKEKTTRVRRCGSFRPGAAGGLLLLLPPRETSSKSSSSTRLRVSQWKNRTRIYGAIFFFFFFEILNFFHLSIVWRIYIFVLTHFFVCRRYFRQLVVNTCVAWTFPPNGVAVESFPRVGRVRDHRTDRFDNSRAREAADASFCVSREVN